MGLRRFALGVLVAMTAVPWLIPTSQAWSASLTVTPTSAVTGQSVTYTVTVENTDAETIGIYSVFVHFDWDAAGIGIYLFDSDPPTSIAVGNTRTFSTGVTIPTGIPTDTSHVVQIDIEATTPGLFGGWSAFDRHSHTFTTSILVQSVAANPAGSSGFPLIPVVALLLVVIVVIVIVAVVATRKRASFWTPTSPPGAIMSPAPVSSAPAVPAQSPTTPGRTCPRCGAPAVGAFCQSCGQKLL